MKIRSIVIIPILILLIGSCSKEIFELEKESDRLEFEKALVGPIVKGTFLLSDLCEEAIKEDDREVLIIDGDTVKLHILRDSLLVYNDDELVIIPDQASVVYNMSPKSDIDVTPFPDYFLLEELVSDTIYTLNLTNSMRLDSLIVDNGQIFINAINSFNYPVNLNIHSDSIIAPNGSKLDAWISIGANRSTSTSIDLTGHKVIFGHTHEAKSFVRLKFSPWINKNGGTGPILSSENIETEFSVSDMNDFEIAYGFMGYYSVTRDTITDIIIEGIEEELKRFDGTFQATNPKIWVNYIQSYGVPSGTDLFMNIYHHNADDATINFDRRIVPGLNDPNAPPLTGSLLFSKLENINELFTFPIADSVYLTGTVESNMGMDSTSTFNFISQNSKLIMGLDIELPLEFRADLTYYDTMKIDIGDGIDEFDFEYLNLHSWFTNSFPLAFDAKLLLYNAELNLVIDSVDLNTIGDKPFIKAAPVDANGVVIKSQVVEEHSYTALDSETANNLLIETTHLIVRAKMQTTNAQSVKVLQSSKLDFQFAIEAKGKITNNSDD